MGGSCAGNAGSAQGGKCDGGERERWMCYESVRWVMQMRAGGEESRDNWETSGDMGRAEVVL